MAKKKDDDPIKPKPAINAGDAVASGLFGGAAFRPIGETLPNFGRSVISGQSPTMMAGVAGVNPLMASGVPSFPSRIGPLISTNYGLPPSDRPDFRNPAEQWDAKPMTRAAPQTTGTGRTISVNDAIAANLSNMSEYDKGFYGAIMRQRDFRNMPESSQGVVEASRSPISGINAMPNTSIQGISVDRTPIASRMAQNTQSFSSQPSFNLAGATQAPTLPSQPQPLQSMAQNIPQAVRPALTKLMLPSGEAWVTAEQRKNYLEATSRQEQEKQDKAARMARFEQAIPEIKERSAARTKARDEEAARRSANFLASLNAERAAREEANAKKEQERGGSGRDASARARQFSVQSELYSQRAASIGTGKRAPFFSWEPITMKSGEQYLPSGMGEYTRITGSGFGSPFSLSTTSLSSYSNPSGQQSSIVGPIASTPFGQRIENQEETFDFTTRIRRRPRRRRPFEIRSPFSVER